MRRPPLRTHRAPLADLAVAVTALACGALLHPGDARAQVRRVTRVNVASDGSQANEFSQCALMSATGRYVAFTSRATNLVPDDTNGFDDLFIRDRLTSETRRVNVSDAGVQSDADITLGSCGYQFSADERYFVFSSPATTLVPNDTNNELDVFRYDLNARTIERVSLTPTGEQAQGASYTPAISSDGRYVAFISTAANLVAGDVNDAADVFVVDTTQSTVVRASVGSAGLEANNSSDEVTMSGDGNLVVFTSEADNLVAGDTNRVSDVFVRNLAAGTTDRVNVSSAEVQARKNAFNPAIDNGGRFVTFLSTGSQLVKRDTNRERDLFLRDLALGTTSRVSVGPGGAQANEFSFVSFVLSNFSLDGRFITFGSFASNLVPADINNNFDTFVRDMQLGVNLLVSVRPRCLNKRQQANETSEGPTISGDGRFVAFASFANNLVDGDTNDNFDIFVAELVLPGTIQDGASPPDSPNVSTCRDDATVVLPILSFAPVPDGTASAEAGAGVSYEVSVRRASGTKPILRRVSKRNLLALQNLPPGQYATKFRIRSPRGGAAMSTGFSPESIFTVPRSR